MAHRWHLFRVFLSANREATLTQSLSVCAEATVDEERVVRDGRHGEHRASQRGVAGGDITVAHKEI